MSVDIASDNPYLYREVQAMNRYGAMALEVSRSLCVERLLAMKPDALVANRTERSASTHRAPMHVFSTGGCTRAGGKRVYLG